MGACLLVWPWAIADTLRLAIGFLVVALGLIGGGFGVLVSARAYDAVLALWSITLFAAAKAGLDGSLWLVPLPLLLVVALVARRQVLRRRLRGDPSIIGFVPRPGFDASRCEFCGERSVGVFAPVIVLSAGFFAARSYTSFRAVCARHARLRTVVPTLVTLLVGWWSVPGLIWTPQALVANAAFGIEADSDVLAEIDADTRSGWRAWLPSIGAVFGVVLGLIEAVGLVNAAVRWSG